RPNVKRLLDPRADKTHLVIEVDALAVDAADACLDLIDVAADPLFDQLEGPLNLLLEAPNADFDVLADLLLEAPKRPFDLLLEAFFDQPDALLDVLIHLPLEAAEWPFDLLLEALFDEPNALLDVPADLLFEKPKTLLELAEGLQRHLGRNRIIAIW